MHSYINQYLTTEYGLSSFINFSIYLLIVISVFCEWKKESRVLAKNIGVILGWWAVMQVFSVLYYIVIGDIWLNQMREIIFSIAYLLSRKKYDLPIRCVLICTLWAGSALVISILGAGGIDPRRKNINIIFYGIIFLADAVFVKKYAVKKYLLEQQYYIVISIILSFIGIISATNQGYETQGDFYNLIQRLTIFASMMVTYYMLYGINLEYERNMEMLSMQSKVEIDRNNYQITQQNYENMRMLRHELKNHDAYIRILLENEEYDKLRTFVSESFTEKEKQLRCIDYGNSVVSAVLNYEIMLAEKEEIELVTDVLVPKEIRLPNTELCSILANVLDNAREACENVEAGERKIQVQLAVKGEYLYIHVENPVERNLDEEAVLKLHTTKANPKMHGYGTKIVKLLVEKHEGTILYQIKDHKFIIDIMVAMEDKKDAADSNL